MTAVAASSGVLGLCLLALPDDTATSLLALGAIAAALVSIAFLVTASHAPGGSTGRRPTPRGAVPVVEWARPRIVPFVDALRGAPLDPALVADGAASLPSPYRVVVPGHHRRGAAT